ncbi:MAG: YqgE/AlgH family protein [Acidobacteria bacterium]|nr:YqgE/AlgH family protein [Acidobacteriota bacterium]
MFRKHSSLLVLGLALLLLAAASGGWGHPSFSEESGHLLQDPIVLEKGVFLVASSDLQDPRFRYTVVLLLTHGLEGTLGLILNRASEMPVSELFPDLNSPGQESNLLFYGGPVGLDGLFFLTRSGEPPNRGTHVLEDVYFSGDRKLLEELLQQGKGPNELRVFLGHSGWSPGQLAAEIAHGDWQLVRADAQTLFEKDLDKLWRDLIVPPPPRPFIVQRQRGPDGLAGHS